MVNHKKSFQVERVGPKGEQQIITRENDAVIANVGKDSKLGANQLEEETQRRAFINSTIYLDTGEWMEQKGKDDICIVQEKYICDGDQFFDHQELYSDKMGPYYSQEFFGHKMGALYSQELDAHKMGALCSQLYGQRIYNYEESGHKMGPLIAAGLPVVLSDQQDEGEAALIPNTCSPGVSLINLIQNLALKLLLAQMTRIQSDGELKHMSQKTYLPEQDKNQKKVALHGSKRVHKNLAGSKKDPYLPYTEGLSLYESGSAGFNKNNILYTSVSNVFSLRVTEIQYLLGMVVGSPSRSHDHSQKLLETYPEEFESETNQQAVESSHSTLQSGTDSGDGIPDSCGGMLEQKPKYVEDFKILDIDKDLSNGYVSKRKKSIDESGDDHRSWDDYPQEGWRKDQQPDPGLKIKMACLGLHPAALSDGTGPQHGDAGVEEQDISSSLTEELKPGEESSREKRPEAGTAAAHQSIPMENTQTLFEDLRKTEDAGQVIVGEFSDIARSIPVFVKQRSSGTEGEASHGAVSRATSDCQSVATQTVPDSTPQREESPGRELNRRQSTSQTTSVSGHDLHSGVMPNVSGRNQQRPDDTEEESRKGTGVTGQEIDSELPECSTPPSPVSAAWGETSPKHEAAVETSLEHETPTVSFRDPVQVSSPGNSQHQTATFPECYADSGAVPWENAPTVAVQESLNAVACGGQTSAIAQESACSVHVSSLAECSLCVGVAEAVSSPPCRRSRQGQDQQECSHPAVQAQDQRESNHPERSLCVGVAEAVSSPPCYHSRQAQDRQEPNHPAVPRFHEPPVSHQSTQPEGRPQSIPAESGTFWTPSEFPTPSESSQPVPLRHPPVTVHAASSLPPWAAQTARIDLTPATDRAFVALRKRRATYSEDWPDHHSGTDATNMALSGFFVIGPGRQVRCFYCGLELDHLTSADNIWDEHVRHSPDCVYLNTVMGKDFVQETLRQLHNKHT
ncbi:hypothetical protein ACOMHN_048664 [Nucella lapillus]